LANCKRSHAQVKLGNILQQLYKQLISTINSKLRDHSNSFEDHLVLRKRVSKALSKSTKLFEAPVATFMTRPMSRFCFVFFAWSAITRQSDLRGLSSVSLIGLNHLSITQHMNQLAAKNLDVRPTTRPEGNGPYTCTMSLPSIEIATSYRSPGPLYLCEYHLVLKGDGW